MQGNITDWGKEVKKGLIERGWSINDLAEPPWRGGKDNVIPLNLPAAISEEFARLILTEFSMEVTGSPMAAFINEQLKDQLTDLNKFVEMYCAGGAIAVKPFVTNIRWAMKQASSRTPRQIARIRQKSKRR